MKEEVGEIYALIRQLDDLKDSMDVITISSTLANLSIRSMYFGEQVSTAYGLMNETEERYKTAVAKHMAGSPASAAKSEREAEVQFAPLKQEHIRYKNIYHSLKNNSDHIEIILDVFRQKVSLLKNIDLKHL